MIRRAYSPFIRAQRGFECIPKISRHTNNFQLSIDDKRGKVCWSTILVGCLTSQHTVVLVAFLPLRLTFFFHTTEATRSYLNLGH